MDTHTLADGNRAYVCVKKRDLEGGGGERGGERERERKERRS